MKTGKKTALVLGIFAGTVLTMFATGTTKKVKQAITKKATDDKVDLQGVDDSEVHYI